MNKLLIGLAVIAIIVMSNQKPKPKDTSFLVLEGDEIEPTPDEREVTDGSGGGTL